MESYLSTGPGRPRKCVLRTKRRDDGGPCHSNSCTQVLTQSIVNQTGYKLIMGRCSNHRVTYQRTTCIYTNGSFTAVSSSTDAEWPRIYTCSVPVCLPITSFSPWWPETCRNRRAMPRSSPYESLPSQHHYMALRTCGMKTEVELAGREAILILQNYLYIYMTDYQ